MTIKITNQKGLADRKERLEIVQPLNKTDLLEIIRVWQEKLKVKPNRIQIRRMSNKWSSCSSNGNLTINSELTRLPREIVEYVILHELLHLIVPNHGKTFKVLLSLYLPNWEELHAQLASYLGSLAATKEPLTIKNEDKY
ncbi:MAG: M48 family metallopeptidase [Methanophagales archaeon]|nr:M48 family metallopeptidase [Methanophagales archaeon]